jgi:hypothetical protein
VILSLILIGLAIALDPLPLTTYFLILASRRGVRKGALFILGWLLSLGIVVAATDIATQNKPPKPNTAPSIAALAVKLLIGLALVFIALRQRNRMGKPKKPKKTPKWQAGIDNMSLWFALALGPLTQPWGLVAAGVAVVVEAKLGSWESYLTLVLFCLIATSSYLVLELLAGFRPERAQAIIASVRKWMETHTDQVIIIGCLVLGAWLVANSIYYIVT